MHFAGIYSSTNSTVTRINNIVNMQGRGPLFYMGTWVLIVRTTRLVMAAKILLAQLGLV
jgi:hypothetical protein